MYLGKLSGDKLVSKSSWITMIAIRDPLDRLIYTNSIGRSIASFSWRQRSDRSDYWQPWSQKVKENEAQKKAGFSDIDGFSALEDMPDADVTMIPETQLEPQSLNEASARIENKIDALIAMTVLFRAEINELKSIHRTEVADLKKIVEQLQIELRRDGCCSTTQLLLMFSHKLITE